MARALRELLDRKLIVRTRYCGPNVFHRASLYGFTDLPITGDADEGVVNAKASMAFLEWKPSPKTKRVTPKRAKRDCRATEPNRTAGRKATAPSAGKQESHTAPPDGNRKDGPPTSNGAELSDYL